MDNPIKVIYKYKNDNRKVQYQYFIFVGSLVGPAMQKIFKKIEKMNLFDALITLTEKEYGLLIATYGEQWYTFFFLTEHISFSIQNIVKSSQKRTDIIHKYNREWYDKHIVKNIYIKRSEYNYQSLFEQNNYIKFKHMKNDDNIDENNEYRTTNVNINLNKMVGGNDDEDDNDDNDDEEDDSNDTDLLNFNKENDKYYEGEKLDIDETYDIEELENIYKKDDTQIDEKPDSIKNLIVKVLEKTNSELNEKETNATHFSKEKNISVYDDLIKKNYEKHFVYSYYIFKSDTIKTIKQKITLSIKNDDKFSKQYPYIIPSRMYLWSEYEYTTGINNQVKQDKIMLGQKWIKRNELLSVDIEPNTNINIYEKLRGNMKLLNDSMKKYGSKIRFEDDENNILNEYDNYYTNNEIFMSDIYNDIGAEYSGSYDDIKNLFQVYVKIYYHNITSEEFNKIVNFVSKDKEKKHYEENIINSNYHNILNDMIMEREISNTIEKVKIDKIDYRSLLKSNFIIQAVIHLNLSFQVTGINKINLYRIFDSYIVNEQYPFLQYQVNGDKLVFKFNQKNKEVDRQAIASKWFENSPYGINFKIKVNQKGDSNNKYIAVSLSETGRLEYKSTWKEEDMATNEDVIKTYQDIKNLLLKINSESTKININAPEDHQFKYAFINTIQHIEFPRNIAINHNDMSDFARYFYPYVSVVIDPRKRMSKKNIVNTKSKYGTYFRYKRISKFDNESKIENRIIYFLRNYEFVPKLLADEISKQFNIVEKEALVKIEEVVNKYPLLKKSRKILKKLQNIPKYKPPGIAIDIQGKKKENYKIRIGGARSQEQLDEIIDFMTILLWLYMDTYINKNPERLTIREKLKSLTNIAKRRNKVEDIVRQENVDNTNIKDMTKLDKDRIGVKTSKGNQHWTRNCQKSGDKNRRPTLYSDTTFDKMVNMGYKLNKTNGDYERTVTITQGSKKKNVIIKAAKFSGENNLFYTCSPEENKEYMFVGFLSRSDSNMCVPCCYKKDPATSKNKFKKNYHLQCMGKNGSGEEYNKNVFGDKLYILQDTNKMLPGRYGYLYKYLDYYFNTVLKKDKIVKNNYLIESKTGYFMKFGSKQDEYPFLNAIASCLDMTYNDIKGKIITGIEDEKIWTFANSGDLKTQFESKEKFIETLNTNTELDHYFTDDLVSIPGLLINEGLNIYIFDRKVKNEKTDFILLCKNMENILYYNDITRKNIILIKEDLNYFPIMFISKTVKDKNIMVMSTYDMQHEIIQHIKNYMKLSCKTISFDTLKINTAKNIYYMLNANDKKELIPVAQHIDLRNKCKYLISKDGFSIPTKPSGIVAHLPINDTIPLKKINDTIGFMDKISSLIDVKVSGFIYTKKEGSKYLVEALYIENQIHIPVEHQLLTKDEMTKLIPSYILESRSLYDIIDKEIEKGESNIVIDKRIETVRLNEFYDEHYELFRYELSNYLNLSVSIKNKIIKILNINSPNQMNQIKSILLKITSDELFTSHESILSKDENKEQITRLSDTEQSDTEQSDTEQSDTEQSDAGQAPIEQTGGNLKFIHVNNEKIDTNNYKLKNNRELCMNVKNMKDCNTNKHCLWHNKCLFRISDVKLFEFISKATNELINDTMKSKELLNIDNYFVLDVININNYTFRKNQKIIKSDNMNIKKILEEIFGQSNIPTIGKRRIFKASKSINEENLLNPLEKSGDYYYQRIINTNALFRAYSNCIYWHKNSMSETEHRNLGYYSDLQTELANTFKSYIYNWINNPELSKTLYDNLKDIINMEYEMFIEEYKAKIFLDKEFYYLGIVDLYILNKQHDIPIMLFDNYDTVFLIIDDGIVYNNINKTEIDNYDSKYNSESLKIKYKCLSLTINTVPEYLQVMF